MNKFYASVKGVWLFIMLLWGGVGFAQTKQWTWVSGDSIAYVRPVYGVKIVASPLNKIGARSSSSNWVDGLNNLWFFGGWNYADLRVNDLWRFTPSTNIWTWMKGDTIAMVKGKYGTKGVASPTNTPGATSNSSSWKDDAGNFWLFGGFEGDNFGENAYNTLWKYDVASNNWIWMNGDTTENTTSNHGIKGVSNSTNHPGASAYSASWKDNSGNFWMYGGNGYDDYRYYQGLSELWKYNPNLNEWVWIAGDTTGNQNSVYGIKGVENATNTPGERSASVSWADNAGNLWLFGGGSTSSNDLWKYNIGSGKWTWMKGDTISNPTAVYGVKGVSAITNTPGKLRYYTTGWVDDSNNFWLFGGLTGNSRELNDLWKYEPATNQWTWVSGDSTLSNPGIYGIRGVSTSSNKPGARGRHTSIVDNNKNAWLFGGFVGAGPVNDLWKYSTPVLTPLHLLTFTAKRANTANLLNWTTAQEVNTDRFEIERSSLAVGGSREFSKIGMVKAANTAYTFTDNNPVNGTNYYRLKMLDKDGAFTYSPIRSVANNHSSFTVAIYPNPAKDNLQLQIEIDKQATLHLQVVSPDGKAVLSTQVTVPQGTSLQSINISKLVAGHYFLKVVSEGKEPVVVGFEKM